MTHVPVIELAYTIAVEDYDGPAHDPVPPGNPDALWVEPHLDVCYVQVLDENSDRVEVLMNLLNEPAAAEDFGDGWTHSATGEWEVTETGPVGLATTEGWLVEPCFSGAGRYGYLSLARVHPEPEPVEPTEQHSVMVCPLGDQLPVLLY